MRALALAVLLGLTVSVFACSSDESQGTGGSPGSGATGAGTTTGTAGATSGTAGGGAMGGAGATGGGGGTAGNAGEGGTGGQAMQSGDCDSDADCPGQKCVEVTPGGFRVCTTTPVESNGCVQPCPAGEKCFSEFGYCGGIVGPMDQCYADACQNMGDCKAGDICVAAGVLGRPVNMCMALGCKHDTDCTAAPGGSCAPVDSACCGIIESLYCVYPGEGCRHETDCAGGYCANDGTKSFCMPGMAPCPI